MKSDVCVQNTNDFSTVSKVSAAAMGYFHDEFQKYFVGRTSRRSPLIHRGYCVRSQAVNHCIREFLQDTKDCAHRQVLSLGCGFDALYFRMCGNLGAEGSTCFWEVDFPAVVERKRRVIAETETLRKMLSKNADCDGPACSILLSEDYKLLGVDLGDLSSLHSALDSAGLTWNCPTLVLAEVVLCYMDPDRSTDVIGWAARRFPHSRFILYEQFSPCDPFGQVMMNHFVSLNSALRSVAVYPRLEDQERRFLHEGWEQCRVLDMNEFSALCISDLEKRCIESLEPFDEFEELHLKCSHYFILVASQGLLAECPALRPICDTHREFSVLPAPEFCGSLPVDPLPASVCGLRRFGHRSCPVSSQVIISAGGFGEGDGKHRRLDDIHLLLREDDTWRREMNASQWDGRLLHSLTLLTGGQVLALGGRFSPSRPANGAHILQYDVVTQSVKITPRDLHPELHRWRHTATEVSLHGKKYTFVFGGRSVPSAALQEDGLFLQEDEPRWVQVQVMGTAPPRCHSQSSSGWKGAAVISGGLLESGLPTGSVYILQPRQTHFEWEKLETSPPLTPRYAHTSHVIGDKLLLVGGVWIHRRGVPGLAVVDLKTGQVGEFQLDTASLTWPLMLHGHSSVLLQDSKQIVILGGGGTCFSFGTHLNAQPVVVDLCAMSNYLAWP
ncbi:PREDICTED: tRNA wybutosine-synthesizing protein 4 [Nanorana parkeri]|uniref:tRNA wybutosine-synthesizing protein 4 n=1 Tax=Nanorana parkeri TaxID=125878 RepID=UPI000854E9A1|nr:PREDICTED: tRNA wybutosine-synthesizing protein 4 [Nanorana parkeri]